MNGPTVILICGCIAGFLVIAHLLYEKDRDERRGDFDGVDEWEQLQRDLAPRWRR